MPVLPEVGSTRVAPGLIDAGRFHRVDHADADTVLHARDRVEEFELHQDLGVDAIFLRQPIEADQRRVADRVGDGTVNPASAGFRSRFQPWVSPECAKQVLLVLPKIVDNWIISQIKS